MQGWPLSVFLPPEATCILGRHETREPTRVVGDLEADLTVIVRAYRAHRIVAYLALGAIAAIFVIAIVVIVVMVVALQEGADLRP